MAKEDIANLDASVRASNQLQSIIRKESSKNERRISVEDALKQPRVAKNDEGRTALRVLFISQDESLLNPETQSLDGYFRLKDLFEEVHILILREGIPSSNPILRPDTNVWLYTATAKHWLQTPKAGVQLAKEQLVFASGFRPDLIVARDPFESAIVATTLGNTYDRPTQLHILEDYTLNSFKNKHQHNYWRRFFVRFTVPKFKSVRTTTDRLFNTLNKNFSIKDISLLPRYQDHQKIMNVNNAIDLQSKYKTFVFFMLYVGNLDHESRLYQAMDAARFALQNPRIGLVIFGDGPARPEFQRRAKILGIEKQVVFEKKRTDYILYLRSAHLLIAPDMSAQSDEFVYAAAAVGVPVVMADTPNRHDIFEDGVSGYLCEADDTQMFADRISDFLNSVPLRKVIGEGGKEAVGRRFHKDPYIYKDSYQKSIEGALFVE